MGHCLTCVAALTTARKAMITASRAAVSLIHCAGPRVIGCMPVSLPISLRCSAEGHGTLQPAQPWCMLGGMLGMQV